jgi:hypothetical protein
VALTVLLIALLTLAAGLVVRWVLRGRTDALGRRRPFPRVGVALALTLAVACAVPLWLHARLESRLESAARQLAGGPVRVHCQTFGQTWTDAGAELGYVRWGPGGVPERSTLIKYSTCGHLRQWLRSDKRAPSREEVVAVHVLTHEVMHMTGLKDEARAECAAVQRDAAMAVALGADPAQGEALARRYWTELYPNLPDGYRGGCGPGGEYDERFAVPPW